MFSYDQNDQISIRRAHRIHSGRSGIKTVKFWPGEQTRSIFHNHVQTGGLTGGLKL